jgi:hypothetical protein
LSAVKAMAIQPAIDPMGDKRCPLCGSTALHRVQRRFWQRLIWPVSRRLLCLDCRQEFLHRF